MLIRVKNSSALSIWTTSILSLALIVQLSACGKQPSVDIPGSTETQQIESQAVSYDKTNWVNVSGSVTFGGVLPEPAKVKMGGNPECSIHAGNISDAGDVLVQNGMVQNAFIYIKDGLEDFDFPVPAEPVEIDQQKCMYSPRVSGVRAGQPIKFLNSDPSLHNIHAFTKLNKAFNVGLPLTGSKATKKFDQPEVMISMKCDIHSWMQGWIGVVAHPYFSVTNAEGRFDFGQVPPGTYTVEVWHERLGTFTQTIEVTNAPVEIKLDFPADA